jgi:hypothetical protein
VHSKGIRHSDGSLQIPYELVAKWELQIATSYSKLSEQESNHVQVKKYLPIIIEAMAEK